MPRVPSSDPRQPDFWLGVIGLVLIVAVLLIGLGWLVQWFSSGK